MMRRVSGLLLVALGVALLVAQRVRASEQNTDGFDALVKGLSTHYALHPKTIPMMWMVSLGARGFTHGGVRGLHVVEFENFARKDDTAGFDETVRSSLDESWSQMVREWKDDGGESLVYVRAESSRIDMIVVDLNHGELNLVKMSMNPDQLAKWTRDKGIRGGFQ
ncbi:MAG TPA: hypothetical protein VHW70_08175 [Edaphobacter sp.]|jgi:hypothetical protein|nr:hypothetical protein [Edaphobacter sp.]